MHLTDDQLNEYLDNETTERSPIEAHLASCDECAARYSALKTLFAEIESLPDLALSSNLAARFTPTLNLNPQLPRWLTLTATLQTVLALIAIAFTAPSISRFLAPILQAYPMPSLNTVALDLQINFAMWTETVRSFQLPALPSGILTLPHGFSTLTLSVSVLGIFFIWILGNWWLLRKRPNSLA